MRVDLAIVGGGFAGSILAMVARKIGLSVVLIDRGRHPRNTVGESSTPAGNMILAGLGECYGLPELIALARYGTWKQEHPELRVGPKRGFSYFAHEPGEPWVARPGHENELLVAASNDPLNCDTHWFRADVDAYLFGRACHYGARLLEECAVERVQRRAGGRPGWEITVSRSDETQVIQARMIADATGSDGFATRHLDCSRGPEMRTRTQAAFGHFEGLPEWTAVSGADESDYPIPADAAAQHHVTPDGWMWQLRFDGGRTSVGIVTPFGGRPSVPLQPDAWIERFPSLAAQFKAARMVWPGSGWKQTGRLQRRVDRAGGNGWVLLPSAAGFVDPLHSTGIAHSLAGIERVALELETGTADFGEAGIQTIEELDHIDAMAAACYAARTFEEFATSTMVYFTASIHFERARVAGREDAGFLGADVPEIRQLALEALRACGEPDYRDWMAKAIEPWNDAGLLRPGIPNMYPHTAPPGW